MASFLDLFSVVDSDGASVARYRLHYLGSTLSQQDSWILGMVTEFAYLMFQLMVVPANALLGAVLSSGQWMEPLSYAYQKVTGPLFAVVPPWTLACLGMAVVAVSAFTDQVRSTTGKMIDRPILDRVGTVFGLGVLVLVLSNNPFALLQKLLEVANEFSVGLAAAISGAGDIATLAGTSQALVDATIRIPTLVLNYGRELSPACQTQWSEAMAAGQALADSSGCFTPGSNVADIGSVATAVIMLVLPALPMLAFCLVAAWKYLLHLTLAAVYTVSTSWIAAVAIFKRRGFDLLATHLARTAAHLAMAVITSMMAAALPTLFAGLGTELLKMVTNPAASAFALMAALGVGFASSTWAIVRVTSEHGALVRILHAETNHRLGEKLGFQPKSKCAAAADRRAKARAAGAAGDDASGSARSARRRGSALADDPVAATTPTDVPPDSKEADMGDAASALAVVALSASAQTPAADVAGSTVVVRPSGRAGGSGGSGYFTGPVAAGPTADAAGPDDDATPADAPRDAVAADDPTRVMVTAAADTGDDGGLPPTPSAVAADDAADTAGTAVAGPAPTVLSGPDQMTRPAPGPVEEPRPGGWRGALAAVTEVVRILRQRTGEGAGFPYPGLFLRRAQEEQVPGAVPHPEYAPHLEFRLDDGVQNPEAPDVADADAAESVNDQQRFNRMRRAGRDVARRGRDISDWVRSRQPATAPSDTRDPASFISPPRDFLAGDAQAAAMEDAAMVLAAAGQPARIELDPASPIGGLETTSDPDERVRPRDAQGFGDPY